MLFAAWATTRPDHREEQQPVVDAYGPPIGRADLRELRAPTASRPPIRPDVTVIEKTAARVMTSHLEIASGGVVIPTGRLAVL